MPEGEKPGVLMKVQLPIIKHEQCVKMFEPQQWADIDNTMLCTYADGKDGCQADSGGPLSCKLGDRWYLTGITSWGIGCASQYPGLWSHVSLYSDWIWSTIREHD